MQMFNPFKPNRISHCYKLDQSITALWVVGCILHFYSNFNRTFCKQTVETLIRRRVLLASALGLYCLPMFHKKDARLIWVKCKNILSSFNIYVSTQFQLLSFYPT